MNALSHSEGGGSLVAVCLIVALGVLSAGAEDPPARVQPPTSVAGPAAARVDTNTWENSLGLRFVPIPGLNVRFAIWETRVQDYRAYLAATGRAWTPPDFPQGPTHPVVNLTWGEAREFCDWLTRLERKSGRLTERQRYRLPTDLEWSAAVGLAPEQGQTAEARWKTSVVWPWGAYWPPQAGDGNYAPELKVDPFLHTAPVGSFRPNRYGLYDLGGNVWEFCEDWFNEANVTKALRGGSFNDTQPKDLLAAYRFPATMHLSNDDLGFRLVLETPERDPDPRLSD